MAYPNGDTYVGDVVNGMRQGEGVYRYKATGNRYDGGFKNNMMDGRGTFTYASGNRYEGGFRGGLKEGSATFYYASGEVDLIRTARNIDVGEGVRWSADRTRAFRLVEGRTDDPIPSWRVPEPISLHEAAQIARANGLPEVPPPHVHVDTVARKASA